METTAHDRLTTRRASRAAAWLALLSLAFSQLALAGHQFDHTAGDIGDPCHACMQLDRIGDAVANHSIPGEVSIALVSYEVPSVELPACRIARTAFDARAPPHA